MTVATFTGTTTAGQTGGTIISSLLPAFTGGFTIDIEAAAALTGLSIVNFTIRFVRSSDGHVCWSDGLSVIHGGAGASFSTWVSGPYGTWSCTDWDTVTVSIDSALACPATTWTFTVTGTFTIPYCEYGTESNPDANTYSIIGSTLVDAVAGAIAFSLGGPQVTAYVEAALIMAEGTTLQQPDCTRLPPPVSSLDLSNLATFQPSAIQAWAHAAYWHYFCRCTPAPGGSPPPTPPPPPGVINVPPDLQPQTPEVCDNADICSTLNAIQRTLASIVANVSYARRDIQIFQRFTTPFAYINGVLHTGLADAGTLDVADLVGLVITATTLPTGVSSDMQTPRDYFVLGHLSLGTADGWERNIRISHNPHLVLPIGAEVTRVAYNLVPGTVVSVQELLVEPIG